MKLSGVLEFQLLNSKQFVIFFPPQKIRYLQTSTFTSMITIFFPILYQMLRGQMRVFVYTLTCQTWARSHVSQTRENASQCRSPGEAFALSLSRWLSLKCVCPTFQSFKCVSPHPSSLPPPALFLTLRRKMCVHGKSLSKYFTVFITVMATG